MSELIEMTYEEWREWYKGEVGHYPTILATYQMMLATGEVKDHLAGVTHE